MPSAGVSMKSSMTEEEVVELVPVLLSVVVVVAMIFKNNVDQSRPSLLPTCTYERQQKQVSSDNDVREYF